MPIQRLLIAFAALAAACPKASAQVQSATNSPPRVFTSARAIHDLPPEAASRSLPVHLRAVVSYYDPYIDARHAAIFAQDASGGIFISVPARPILPLQAGTLIDVNGVTGPGDYAAVILSDQVRAVGKAQLPPHPVRVTLTELLSGDRDCQWVQIEGRVRSVRFTPHNVALEIATDGGSFDAVSVRQDGVDYPSLVDSLIRIRGNAAPVFNKRRQMVGVHLFVPTIHEISVIQPAPRDPFAVAAVPLSELFRFSPDPGLLHRVHVQGAVTLDWPGRMLCIQDAKDGICMQTTQAASVPVGSFVDVVGFPSISMLKPTLEDAVFRDAGAPPAPPQPVSISADQAIKGDLDGKLVQLDAALIGRDSAAAVPTLMLRSGGVVFPAILPRDTTVAGGLPWKEGSVVRLVGVCNVQVDSLSTNLSEGAVRADSVHILLRSLGDVSLLQAPSWWTAEHTLESFSFAGLLVLASLVWIAVLRHRVAVQTQALRGSEERLRHLSEHDALTGLPNRILLNDRLQTSLKRAVRFRTCLGLLMVDADEFKVVNDALGHQAGDKVLCEMAERLTGCVRSTDTVARMGGDEFIVLLPDLRYPVEAEHIATKIVACVAAPYKIDSAQAVVTVSVGVVTYPETSGDLESLMHCADEAMYKAKEKGKNRLQVYKPEPSVSGASGRLRPAPQAS